MTNKERKIVLCLKIIFTVTILIPIIITTIIEINYLNALKAHKCSAALNCECKNRTCVCSYLLDNGNVSNKKIKCPYNKEKGA